MPAVSCIARKLARRWAFFPLDGPVLRRRAMRPRVRHFTPHKTLIAARHAAHAPAQCFHVLWLRLAGVVTVPKLPTVAMLRRDSAIGRLVPALVLGVAPLICSSYALQPVAPPRLPMLHRRACSPVLRLRTAAEAFAAEEFIAEMNADHADELRRLVRQQNDADGVDWSVEKMESVRLLEVDDDGLHLEEVLHAHPLHTPSAHTLCTHPLHTYALERTVHALHARVSTLRRLEEVRSDSASASAFASPPPTPNPTRAPDPLLCARPEMHGGRNTDPVAGEHADLGAAEIRRRLRLAQGLHRGLAQGVRCHLRRRDPARV